MSTTNQEVASPGQFNFARNWKRKIAPLLTNRDVFIALNVGLWLSDLNCRIGDPPWLVGRGPLNGQRAREGCLSWYQPWGRCHHIAPFCFALGQKLFPNLKWGFMSGGHHTVVIGYDADFQEPVWVMDILLFRQNRAQESLDFVKTTQWRFFDSLAAYVSSFCQEPEAVHDMISADLRYLAEVSTVDGVVRGQPTGDARDPQPQVACA